MKGGEILEGNIVKIDNLNNKNGFVKTSTGVRNKYRKERKFYEFMLWSSLQDLAGTDFELTVKSVRTIMGGQREKAQRALKTLEADGLIKARLEKEITGKKFIITNTGRKVPNTRRIYEIYTAFPEVQEQTVAPFDDFTVDEIKASECITPPQELAEMPPPVLKPPQSRGSAQRDSKVSAGVERQKEQVYRIAAANGLFSKIGKDKLLYWLRRFAKEVGRPAKDEEIKTMAIFLSNDSNYNLTDYIKNKALSEQPA